jgi:hypothetical protein
MGECHNTQWLPRQPACIPSRPACGSQSKPPCCAFSTSSTSCKHRKSAPPPTHPPSHHSHESDATLSMFGISSKVYDVIYQHSSTCFKCNFSVDCSFMVAEQVVCASRWPTSWNRLHFSRMADLECNRLFVHELVFWGGGGGGEGTITSLTQSKACKRAGLN